MVGITSTEVDSMALTETVELNLIATVELNLTATVEFNLVAAACETVNLLVDVELKLVMIIDTVKVDLLAVCETVNLLLDVELKLVMIIDTVKIDLLVVGGVLRSLTALAVGDSTLVGRGLAVELTLCTVLIGGVSVLELVTTECDDFFGRLAENSCSTVEVTSFVLVPVVYVRNCSADISVAIGLGTADIRLRDGNEDATTAVVASAVCCRVKLSKNSQKNVSNDRR